MLQIELKISSCIERSRYKNCHLELSSFLCFEGFACVPLWTEAGSDYRPSSAGVAPMQGIRFGIRDGCLRDSNETGAASAMPYARPTFRTHLARPIVWRSLRGGPPFKTSGINARTRPTARRFRTVLASKTRTCMYRCMYV